MDTDEGPNALPDGAHPPEPFSDAELVVTADHDSPKCRVCVEYASRSWPKNLELRELRRMKIAARNVLDPGLLPTATEEQRIYYLTSFARERAQLTHVRASRWPGEDATAWLYRMGYPNDQEERPRDGQATKPPKVPSRLRYRFVDDDPSEWEALPTSWPHDHQECMACFYWARWKGGRVVGPREKRRVVSDLAEYADYFPQRFRAMSRHTHLVAVARIAATRERIRTATQGGATNDHDQPSEPSEGV